MKPDEQLRLALLAVELEELTVAWEKTPPNRPDLVRRLRHMEGLCGDSERARGQGRHPLRPDLEQWLGALGETPEPS